MTPRAHLASRLRPFAAALVATAALAVTACGGGNAPARAAGTPAALVNGRPVARALYDHLVQASERRMERLAGLSSDPSTAAGAARRQRIEAQVLQQLVQQAVIAQLADRRHITVADADVTTAVLSLQSLAGGAAGLQRRLETDDLSRDDLRALLRTAALQQRLQQADPAGFQQQLAAALASASVQAYVAPCDGDHSYPRCLGPAAP